MRSLKHLAKRLLALLSDKLDAASWFIQIRLLHQTHEQRRCATHYEMPLADMDRHLLGTYIRFSAHQVEKAVRYRRQGTRGQSAALRAQAACREWESRGYGKPQFIIWAEHMLRDFESWSKSGEPQLTPVGPPPPSDTDTALLEALRNRSSTRFWLPRPVEDEKIRQLLEVAVHAPTSCNRQTWKLYVQRNQDLDISNSMDSGVANETMRLKAPVVIYIVIDERLILEKWVGAEDAGIMGLQLSLAASALGLGGCLMYGGDEFTQPKWRALLNLPKHHYMYLMYMFGYPAERTITNKRADPDDVGVLL